MKLSRLILATAAALIAIPAAAQISPTIPGLPNPFTQPYQPPVFAPNPAPMPMPQTTTCRPDGLGGFRCTTW